MDSTTPEIVLVTADVLTADVADLAAKRDAVIAARAATVAAQAAVTAAQEDNAVKHQAQIDAEAAERDALVKLESDAESFVAGVTTA